MRSDSKDFAADTDPLLLRLGGMVRRMAISLTAKALWQLVGFRQADGKPETRQVEVFSGIGFFARPSTSGKPEAIVNMIGGEVPVIVATRDEATRAQVAGGLQPDETMIFTSKAMVYIKADGSIEIRSVTGAAAAIAMKDDLDVLRSALNAAVISLGAGGAATVVTAMDAALTARVPSTGPWPNGSQKLKGE